MNSDSNGEPSSQNEISALTVAVPVVRTDGINHSGSIAAAQTSLESRMV